MKANPNYLYLKKNLPKQRVVNLQGGTRSGKTFSVIYYIIDLCLKHKGLEIDIVRDTYKSLKATAWKDFEQVLVELGRYNSANHNKSDSTYKLDGNLISYYGVDDDEKVHGKARDILWINEANQISGEVYDQLSPRTRWRIINDFNPALGDDSWLDPILEEYPPKITTYRDNPHLTKAQVLDIESKKGQPYWWSVYGKGERAKREGVIFQYEKGLYDDSLISYYGLDFGFVNDPDSCVKVAIDQKLGVIYVKEVFFEYGQTVDQIARAVNGLDSHTIVADSAEQRLIDFLRSKCNKSIRAVKKGAGSVVMGIRLMENYKIVVAGKSPNLIKELNNYAWSSKKKETPIDDYNHCIDAIRYVVWTYANKEFKQPEQRDTTNKRFKRGLDTGNVDLW